MPTDMHINSKRPVVPELRSIPLTFMDCQDHREVTERYGQRAFVEKQGIYDTHTCMFGSSQGQRWAQAAIGCSVRRETGKCPRGFPS